MNQHKEPCPACGGDGGFHVARDVDRTTGALIEDWRPCPYCAEKFEWTPEYEYQDREQRR